MTRSGVLSQLTGTPEMQARFLARKAAFADSLMNFRAEYCHDQQRFADLLGNLHKFSGIAGLFGAGRLGVLAADGHETLRSAAPGQRAALICALQRAVQQELER